MKLSMAEIAMKGFIVGSIQISASVVLVYDIDLGFWFFAPLSPRLQLIYNSQFPITNYEVVGSISLSKFELKSLYRNIF